MSYNHLESRMKKRKSDIDAVISARISGNHRGFIAGCVEVDLEKI